MCHLSIKGKINFLQLSRHSEYSEQYFRINSENGFNFQDFNFTLISSFDIKECIIAFDPSYIPKSGKSTFGTGYFWSGCAKKNKWGLDICGFAAVDVTRNTAFHLNALQTPSTEMPLLEHYCGLLKENGAYFKELSAYLVADAFFSKKKVIDTTLSLGMHFVGRLRDDASMQYIYQGEKTGKKGAPKKYDGKVNPHSPDMNHFCEAFSSEEIKIFSAIVHYGAFDRKIKLAIAVFYKNGKEIARKLYFSTDLELSAIKIVRYYRSRFQIEFIYRDAKQYCGLNTSQARSKNKLHTHFNAALTAVNLAKFEHVSDSKNKDKPFSMSDYKTMYHNEFMLQLFFRKLGINPNSKKNKQIINELKRYGTIAA